MNETVGILDAGSQYGKLIDRRLRELHVRTELLPFSILKKDIPDYIKAIVISGGPNSVYAKDAPFFDKEILGSMPVLGICYGMQLINYINGGSVQHLDIREDGVNDIELDTESLLFQDLNKSEQVLLTHGDSITEVAPNFKINAKSKNLISGIENSERKIYGVQFHPEVNLTKSGSKMFNNFLTKICSFKLDFSIENREMLALTEIKNLISKDPNKTILIMISGGVDSTVCAALIRKVVPPEKIIAVHVDTGFMREQESEKVKIALKNIGLDIKIINAAEQFKNATITIDPEERRSIIGDTFIRVVDQVLREELNLSIDKVYLAQGTLRPDLIESASKMASSKADVIKTHHNDTNLVRELRNAGSVLEPLKDLHKDEVRKLGESLGLPHDLVWRHPFPGPGLAIRVVCANKNTITDPDYIEVNQKLNELNNIQSIHASLLPFKSVGIQGDQRSYKWCMSLTCTGHPDWTKLIELSKSIPMTQHNINRVLFTFGNPLTDQEIFNTPEVLLTNDILKILRKADDIVTTMLLKKNIIKNFAQFPVILAPLGTKYAIILRPFITEDFMTGESAKPRIHISETDILDIVHEILNSLPEVSRVMYDLSDKPPGTTEFM